MKQKITIVGGGSTAHALIPLLSRTEYDISILTRRPDKWSHQVSLRYQGINGDILDTISGRLHKISSYAREVIPETDVIILCMPVSQYRDALHEIAQHIPRSKEVFVGTIYGQGGFNWMVEEIQNKFSLPRIIRFAFGLTPWICRTLEYGKVGVTYGPTAVNIAAVFPEQHFTYLNDSILNRICKEWFGEGGVRQADNFLSLTLSVDNQIIHPTRCYGLYKTYGKTWNNYDEVPYFYRDYDDISAGLLLGVDTEYSLIREGIRQRFPKTPFTYMLDYLTLERLSNQSNNYDIKQSFINSKNLYAIKTPVIQNHENKWEIDINHRFFMDDIYYGLCIAKWMAEQMAIPVPTIDEILLWAQQIRQEHIIDAQNRLLIYHDDLRKDFKAGLPPYYGRDSINDILD